MATTDGEVLVSVITTNLERPESVPALYRLPATGTCKSLGCVHHRPIPQSTWEEQ